MKKLHFIILFIILSLTNHNLKAETNVREVENFNKGWKFNLGEISNKPEESLFDDSKWRILNLPHDWSIEGEFNEKNPATPGGGALPGGIGWYRKTFSLDESKKGKLIFIDFDGVYRNSEVWINGHYIGIRPYGYSSFRYEITQYLNFGAKKNVIAVKVDNSKQPNSRWYSGSGIYRNVWLVTTDKVFVDHWGTFITTPSVTEKSATLSVSTKLVNRGKHNNPVTLNTIIISPNGKEISRDSKIINFNNDSIKEVNQSIAVINPILWSDINPVLYKIVSVIEKDNKVLDSYSTSIGIRSFVFDREKGFLLNGKSVKIKGVCNHHDLGCLGSAINTRALERQLEILKEMGCNGIRTSHNPPAPELLDLCDKMGFIVMDEAFDMWRKKKTEFDYSFDFIKWHKRDLEDMILRDRNHPSVFIWSIGNEILEQFDSTGIEITKDLAAIVRSLDNTRPITSACNEPTTANYIIKSRALDLVGYNYHHEIYPDFLKTFKGSFIASETTSSLNSRGIYDMPSDSIRKWPIRWDLPFTTGNKDLSCSSYDNCRAPWGSTHQDSWKMIKKFDFLSGMFIWTGFDYLGEPTPYTWPARSSYFGIVDLCGFPKDAYYMYQSEWTNKPVLHLLPHWNWKQGDTIDVWAYTNFKELELFLNGKSMGVKQKGIDDLHLQWKVPYIAGTLKAIALNNGSEVFSTQIKTAGKAAKIILTPDKTLINADESDLTFVKVSIVDSEGNLVPKADNLVQFKIEGDASIAGVDNGSQTSMELFKANNRKAFNGLCLAVLKAGKNPGKVKLIASSEGLMSSEVVIQQK